MGFNSVYKCLQEIFPQVDARILRAVAIEHPKDVDLAAGIVLAEVIPFMSKRPTPPSIPPYDKGHGTVINIEDEQGDSLRQELLLEKTYFPCSIPVENDTNANSSSGPPLIVIQDETTLSNTCKSNDSNNNLLRVNESEVQHLLGNAGEDLSGDVFNKINEITTFDLRHLTRRGFDLELDPIDVGSENMFSYGMCQEMEPEQTPLTRKTDSTNNNSNGKRQKDLDGSTNDDNNVMTCSITRILENTETALIEGEDSEVDMNNGKGQKDFDGSANDDNDAMTCSITHILENTETAFFEGEDSVVDSVNHNQRNMPNAKECSRQSEFVCGPSCGAGKNLENGCSFSEVEDSVSEAGDVEDKINNANNVVGQSNQICRIDLFEKIIDEAKTNKKTLFSSMESLIKLMREVELQEKAAEQAKMEAALGGSEILIGVEELKKMLLHAKEANDMHAGEVYGEKAILATEMKELQSRLLNLSDERDKSLAILDEMSQALEVRLRAAEEQRKAAEQEKLEKEESARKALAEQEAIMEKVVRESTKLQMEAEENTKLREFLMDRGRVVDMLQGEISVICEDIRLLKEKFDANLPLSKSFTSSQTTCMLASSGSSHKSLASDLGSDQGDLPEAPKTKPAFSIDEPSSKSGYVEEQSKTEDKLLIDDEWDYIFEKDVELNSSAF